jgi:hypothetical protein
MRDAPTNADDTTAASISMEPALAPADAPHHPSNLQTISPEFPQPQYPSYLRLNLPKHRLDRIDAVVSRLICLSLLSPQSWQPLSEKQSQGLNISQLISPLDPASATVSSSPCYRGDLLLPFSITEIFSILTNPQHKKLLHDPSLDVTFPVNLLNLHTTFSYQKYHEHWPLSPRDYCLLTHWRLLSDGSFLFVSYSDTTRRCPPFEGIVRGDVRVEGYLMCHVHGGTQVTFFSEVDRGGGKLLLPVVVKRQRVILKPLVLRRLFNILLQVEKRRPVEKFVCPAPPIYDGLSPSSLLS